jgi:hypothetical protein
VSKQPTIQAWSWKLKDLMRSSGRTGRSVERQLRWGTGYMSQILREGPPALKVEHVLSILEAIEVPPGEFFADLYDLAPRAQADATQSEIRKVVEEMLEEQRQRERAELDDVRRYVRELVQQQGTARSVDRDEIRSVVGEIVREEFLRIARTPTEDTPRMPRQQRDEGGSRTGGGGKR